MPTLSSVAVSKSRYLFRMGKLPPLFGYVKTIDGCRVVS
jgi:hypothetical protein